MQDVISHLASTKRPRLLVRAARIGAGDYRREVHLARLLGGAEMEARAALDGLISLEGPMERARRRGAADYSAARHVEVLAAIIGETRLARAAEARRASALPKAV